MTQNVVKREMKKEEGREKGKSEKKEKKGFDYLFGRQFAAEALVRNLRGRMVMMEIGSAKQHRA